MTIPAWLGEIHISFFHSALLLSTRIAGSLYKSEDLIAAEKSVCCLISETSVSSEASVFYVCLYFCGLEENFV